MARLPPEVGSQEVVMVVGTVNMKLRVGPEDFKLQCESEICRKVCISGLN